MNITTDRTGNVAVIRVGESRLMYPLLSEFSSAVTQLIAAGERRVVVNLSTVGYVDSATIGCLMDLYRQASAAGGSLKLAGVQKRVELGRALAMKPKLLLLDEPVAGMNLEETEDMARFILDIREDLGTAMIMVEHDMGLVMDLADRVMVVDFGTPIATGTPAEVQADPAVIAAYLGGDLEHTANPAADEAGAR